MLIITRSWERILSYSRNIAQSGVSLWEVPYFVLCLTVYSVMRNTRLWQCRRGLCPSDWSALCWRPIRMDNRSLHVVIRFVQPQTWSCCKVGSPSTTATLKDTSVLKIYCVQHAKKIIDGKQQVSKPWNSNFFFLCFADRASQYNLSN